MLGLRLTALSNADECHCAAQPTMCFGCFVHMSLLSDLFCDFCFSCKPRGHFSRGHQNKTLRVSAGFKRLVLSPNHKASDARATQLLTDEHGRSALARIGQRLSALPGPQLPSRFFTSAARRAVILPIRLGGDRMQLSPRDRRPAAAIVIASASIKYGLRHPAFLAPLCPAVPTTSRRHPRAPPHPKAATQHSRGN